MRRSPVRLRRGLDPGDSFSGATGSTWLQAIDEMRGSAAMQLNRAFDSTSAVLATVQPGQLDAPTPCVSWVVRDLINHFVGTARWWAGTLTGDYVDADADYTAGDVVAAYQQSMKIAVTAFSADGVPDQMVRLPFGEFPGAVVEGMAALDQFAHGWDLARAIGHSTDLDPGLAAELLGQARITISDALRGPEGEAPFGPARAAPAGASAADQLAAFLGRVV
jgi:uncharacterized protein (TIGR03086 family)